MVESRVEYAAPRARARDPQTPTACALACRGEGRTWGSYSFPPQGLLLSQPEPGALPTRCLPGGRRDRGGGRRAEQRTCGHKGPLQDQGRGCAHPRPAQTKFWTQLSCPERKAQTTLYFSNEINSPHTIRIHLCKPHCPRPPRDRQSRLPRSLVTGGGLSGLPCRIRWTAKAGVPGRKPSQPAGLALYLSFFSCSQRSYCPPVRWRRQGTYLEVESQDGLEEVEAEEE